MKSTQLSQRAQSESLSHSWSGPRGPSVLQYVSSVEGVAELSRVAQLCEPPQSSPNRVQPASGGATPSRQRPETGTRCSWSTQTVPLGQSAWLRQKARQRPWPAESHRSPLAHLSTNVVLGLPDPPPPPTGVTRHPSPASRGPAIAQRG